MDRTACELGIKVIRIQQANLGARKQRRKEDGQQFIHVLAAQCHVLMRIDSCGIGSRLISTFPLALQIRGYDPPINQHCSIHPSATPMCFGVAARGFRSDARICQRRSNQSASKAYARPSQGPPVLEAANQMRMHARTHQGLIESRCKIVQTLHFPSRSLG